MQVPWLERMNFGRWYSSSVPSSATRTAIDAAVDVLDDAGAAGAQDLARVDDRAVLHAGADERRLRAQQRHGLALHVRAHEGAVRVVVLEERDERGRHRHHLPRRDVHVVDLRRLDLLGLAALEAAQHAVAVELAGLRRRTSRSPAR